MTGLFLLPSSPTVSPPPPSRQPRGGLHVRHLLGRRGLHAGARLQPRRAGLVLLRPQEDDGLVAGCHGLVRLGRLQWPCGARHALQPGLRGRQGEEGEGRPGAHEPAQQPGRQEGEEALDVDGLRSFWRRCFILKNDRNIPRFQFTKCHFLEEVFYSGKGQKYLKILIYQMSFLEKVFYSENWQKYFKI